MADLKNYQRDDKAFKEGDWKRPNADDDLEILTRGMGDAYQDAQAAAQRRAAVSLGGDTDKIPVAIKRAINVDCLIKHCLIDVRGLKDGGDVVDFAAFCELIRNPEYGALASAAFTAASMVSVSTAANAKDAAKN